MADAANIAVGDFVKRAISDVTMGMICNVIKNFLNTELKNNIFKDVNASVDALIDERVNKLLEAVRTKAALQAELDMTKRLSTIRIAVVKNLQDHLELRSRQFEGFSALLEQNCIDSGEDGLGAGGPYTAIVNMAHELNDADNEFLEQTVNLLEAKLPGETVIGKIQAQLVKVNTNGEDVEEEAVKEGASKEEGTTNGVH